MSDLGNCELEILWNDMDEKTKNDIVQFWLNEKAILDETTARERVDQVIMIARDTQQRIVAACTAFETYNEQLENYFYYYRTFVAASHRRSNLARSLIVEARQYFESCFAEGTNVKVIGMFVSIESEVIKRYRNEGIWPNSRFVYIGKNERGDHLRVCYFEGARINQDHLQ